MDKINHSKVINFSLQLNCLPIFSKVGINESSQVGNVLSFWPMSAPEYLALPMPHAVSFILMRSLGILFEGKEFLQPNN